MGMIFVDYAWIINGRSFKFRLFSAILMIIKKGGDEHMRSKYQRLKFIEKYHLLPVIASIPAITFILYQLLPDFSVLNFDVSHEAALLIFILVIPTIGCLYLVNLFVFFPYLIYMYFSTLRRKLPLSPTFRLINRVFISILLIIFIITADYNRYIFPVQYDRGCKIKCVNS